MMKFGFVGCVITFMGLLSTQAQAGTLKAYCTLAENDKEVINQLPINKKTNKPIAGAEERFPIASVSKVFTSLFAITNGKNSVETKVKTEFYFTPTAVADVYDVHIAGGFEPYFNRESMQWLISKLNEAGVKKINNLTFDENFKFLIETDKIFKAGRTWYSPVIGKNNLTSPEPDFVKTELLMRSELLKNYDKTKKMAALNGVTLSKELVYAPKKVEFLSSKLFSIKKNTKKSAVYSPDLLHMLKLMSWNSNNHAADKIFQLSGGLQKFEKLFYQDMKFTQNDLLFVNGSGQNKTTTGREYNEASCATVVRVVKGLKINLEKNNKQLQDVLAVVGGDVSSTVSGKTYNNPITRLSVMAKSGTVGTNVSLAGMVSAQSGNHFFFFNVETNPVPGRIKGAKAVKNWMNGEENRCRAIISAELNKLVKKLGGGNPINYTPKFFDPERFEDAEETGVEGVVESSEPIVQNDKEVVHLSQATTPITTF